jgi:hypothetical protein
VFWYFKKYHGQINFDIELRDGLFQRLSNYIFSQDNTWQTLRHIGFGTDEDTQAIEAEYQADKDVREGDYPEHYIEYAFLDRANDWLRESNDGLMAVLNYDTPYPSVVLPLQEAIDKIDDLPIPREQFFELLVARGYAQEETE